MAIISLISNNQINPNVQNNNVDNIQIKNKGQFKDDQINNIKIICSSLFKNENPESQISKCLKQKLSGEWIVIICKDSDNFEFGLSSNSNNILVLSLEQNNIYIYKYI